MSMTQNVGLMKLGCLAYAACALSECLEKIAFSGYDGNQIPKNVHHAGVQFLKLARDATKLGMPVNPLANITAYRDALHVYSREFAPVMDRTVFDKTLDEYIEALENVATIQKRATLGELSRFFNRAYMLGEEDIARERHDDDFDE